MLMKSAGNPELLGSLHLQNAGLSRARMMQQKMGASSESPTIPSTGAAFAFNSFRSFLNMGSSLPVRLASGESELEGLDSGVEPSAMPWDRLSKSAESSTTHKHSDRSEKTKSGDSKQPAASPIASTAMQAIAGVSEAPVVLFPPNSPTQRAQLAPHQARPQIASGMASADIHPSRGEMSSAATPATAAQTFPIVPSSEGKGQSVKLGSEPAIASTAGASSATVSPAAPRPLGATPDVLSLSPARRQSIDGLQSHLQEDVQEDTPLDSVNATHDLAQKIAQPTSKSKDAPLQPSVVVPSIHAAIESMPGQSDMRAKPASQTNQTQAAEPKASKVLRQNESEPAQTKTAVAAPTTEKHADSALMAHESMGRPVTASGPTGVAHLTKEIPNIPTVANPGPGANSPEGATVLARTSPSKTASGEPLAILENNFKPPAPAWTHAGTTKVEAGFQDPSLGWVGVRAATDPSGVHAAILPSSPDASRMLSGSMADLGAYLTEQHHSVQSLTMASPPSAEAGNAGGSYDGASLAQGNTQEQGYGQQEGTNSEGVIDHEAMSSVSGDALDSAVASAIYSAPGGALISVFA